MIEWFTNIIKSRRGSNICTLCGIGLVNVLIFVNKLKPGTSRVGPTKGTQWNQLNSTKGHLYPASIKDIVSVPELKHSNTEYQEIFFWCNFN